MCVCVCVWCVYVCVWLFVCVCTLVCMCVYCLQLSGLCLYRHQGLSSLACNCLSVLHVCLVVCVCLCVCVSAAVWALPGKAAGASVASYKCVCVSLLYAAGLCFYRQQGPVSLPISVFVCVCVFAVNRFL